MLSALSLLLCHLCVAQGNVLGVVDFGVSGLEYTIPESRLHVERKSAASLTQAVFGRLHEGENGVPVVLTGAIDHWPSFKEGPDKWTKEYLVDTAGLEELEVTVILCCAVPATAAAVLSLLRLVK